MNPQELAQHRAGLFQEALRRVSDPNSIVNWDWNRRPKEEEFYSYEVALHKEVLHIEFTAEDVPHLGMNEKKWVEEFMRKVSARAEPPLLTR